MSSALEIHGLTKQIASTQILKGIDLTVDKGIIQTLLGPSGCGKTTILRCVAGLLEPDDGEIEIDGTVIFSRKDSLAIPPEKRDIAMVFQSYALWPHMTVFENVAFPLQMRHISGTELRSKVKVTLELVRIEELEDRYPFQISGGQQQRVALARAFVADPKLVLLDEPLGNLDANLREHLRFELRDLQRKTGSTFLYVTHDQGEALALSDKIALMFSGTIVELGAPDDIYMHPSSRFAAEFLGITNVFEATLKGNEAYVRPGNVIVQVSTSNYEKETQGDIKIAVNAEDVEVYPESTKLHDRTNVFVGRVVRSSFTGMNRHHWIALEDSGERIPLRVIGSKKLKLDPNTKVIVRIPPNAVKIVSLNVSKS
jgi:iron(III) transport system ATP-binding protein